MYEDEPDDPIPPLDRPGVAPLWRVTAIVTLLVAALLLSMVAVLFVSLASQGTRPVNNAFAMAPPAMVGGAAEADPAEEAIDPANPAYPTRQDLRPPGTFPLAGDPEADPQDQPRSPRQEFRALADKPAAWVCPGPDLPERVLVSPDGQNMAFAGPEGLMVGPVGAPNPVGQDVAAGAIPPGVRFARRMPLPGQPQRWHPSGTRSSLSGWSPDGGAVAWVTDSGRPSLHDMKTKVNTHFEFKADALLPLPGDERYLVIDREPQPKLGGFASSLTRDRTAVKVMPPPGAKAEPTVVSPAQPDRRDMPAVSPDGKRLAVVTDNHGGKLRWQVGVVHLDQARAIDAPAPAQADRFEGLCWTPDSKGLIYARSHPSPPPDFAPGTPKDACDLCLLNLDTMEETRLSRGGGFSSPSVTKDGDLYFLMTTAANGAPTVQLLKMPLKAAREWAEGQEKSERDRAKVWQELPAAVFKRAGTRPDQAWQFVIGEGGQKKLADAFARVYKEKFNAEAPATAEALEEQRRELAALNLNPEEHFVLILGAVEGEYLRGKQKGTEWRARSAQHAPAEPVKAENAFGLAFNPFRPLRAPDKPEKDAPPHSLREVLYRAEGRPIVLSNDPAAAKEALDKLVDPDRARADELLAQRKREESGRLLLALAARHADNQYLTIDVGTALYRGGNAKLLPELVKPLLAEMDRGGASLARDPRLHDLIGVGALEGDPNKAILAFQDALHCDLNYGPAYLNLAQAYQKTGRTRDARLCLRQYLKLFPEGEWADDARRRLAAAGDD
jgi:tetratricopeptide (TPR) repeat protein